MRVFTTATCPRRRFTSLHVTIAFVATLLYLSPPPGQAQAAPQPAAQPLCTAYIGPCSGSHPGVHKLSRSRRDSWFSTAVSPDAAKGISAMERLPAHCARRPEETRIAVKAEGQGPSHAANHQ